jgi:hypothetical protein
MGENTTVVTKALDILLYKLGIEGTCGLPSLQLHLVSF